MKFLIAGGPDKYFHLRDLGEQFKKYGIDYELIKDIDYAPNFSKKSIGDFINPRKKFGKLIQKEKPDVVFVDRRTNFGVYTTKTNIPLFVHLRGDIWSEAKWEKENFSTKEKIGDLHRRKVIWEKNFNGSTLILPICKYLGEIVKQRYPDKKVEVMYQGIDPSKWYPEEGMKLKHPCVGLLQSSTIWGKAQEMLTLEKVLKEMPDVTFYWVGDGTYSEKVLSVLNKYDNFEWLGSLEYPGKVRQYLTEIDIYALISGIDMAPLTLLEAQLMQKPVIATKVGGIPELMKNNETGFLVDKGDHHQIIDTLSIILQDKEKAVEMGKKGRKFVEENFSWGKIVKDFITKIKPIIQP